MELEDVIKLFLGIVGLCVGSMIFFIILSVLLSFFVFISTKIILYIAVLFLCIELMAFGIFVSLLLLEILND